MTLAPLVDRFRDAIAGQLGLSFDTSKDPLLAEVLERRSAAAAAPPAEYLRRFEQGALSPPHHRELVCELTVSETFFFRHLDQFRAFADVAVPARIEARRDARALSVLSAGCSSGEEPYSLAILLQDQTPPGWTTSVLGVDLNAASLEKARRGRYTEWSLRETGAAEREHFVAEGKELVLRPSVRAAVQFEEKNLTTDDAQLWQPERYDVAFCRNVLMYFTPEQARGVVDRLAASLAPGAYLFVGHAETLRGLSNDFHLRHTHGTFYYQRKGAAAAGSPARRTSTRPALSTAHRLAPDALGATSWVATIRQTADRIRALDEHEHAPALEPATPVAPSDLSQARELVAAERYAHALELLGDGGAADAEALLLRAVVFTHAGRLEEATLTCMRLLELDELSSGAHYLLALCAEGQKQLRVATDEDHTAAYLDPTFAMPRLHLGLMARRSGDRDTAQRELGQALALLERDDPARLLLYGGGFSREGLVCLCRAELSRLGAGP